MCRQKIADGFFPETANKAIDVMNLVQNLSTNVNRNLKSGLVKDCYEEKIERRFVNPLCIPLPPIFPTHHTGVDPAFLDYY